MISPFDPSRYDDPAAPAAFADLFAHAVAQASMRLAVAGSADDVVQIFGRPNWFYARLDGADGERVEVHDSVIRPNLGDALYVIRDQPLQAGGYRVAFWLRGAAPAGRAPVGDGANL